jgi:hypothetical protein
LQLQQIRRHHPWIGTFDTGLIHQVSPNFSVDVNSFFGLTDSADDCNLFIGFAASEMQAGQQQRRIVE